MGGLAIASAVLISCVCSAAPSKTLFGANDRGMKPITVAKAKGRIKIDGKATEKDWKKAKNLASLANGRMGVVSNGKDMSAWKRNIPLTSKMAKVKVWKLLWNSKGLYSYIEVADKTKCAQVASTGPTNSDSVEYHIDAANKDRTSYVDKNEAQYRLMRNGKTVSGWGSWDRNAFKANAKGSQTNTGYKQEVMIQWKNHGIKSQKVGKKVGFDLLVNDAVKKKGEQVRTYVTIWNSWNEAWENPSTMGTLIMGK